MDAAAEVPAPGACCANSFAPVANAASAVILPTNFRRVLMSIQCLLFLSREERRIQNNFRSRYFTSGFSPSDAQIRNQATRVISLPLASLRRVTPVVCDLPGVSGGFVIKRNAMFCFLRPV